MVGFKLPQHGIVGAEHEFNQPGRGGVVVNSTSIAGVEEPAVFQPDCHAAMPPGMPVQRHQPHLRGEEQADGWQTVPGIVLGVVQLPLGDPGNVAGDVSHIAPAVGFSGEGGMFALMDVHGCPGEIRQTAAVVKMHVGEDDVADVFRAIAEPLDLVEGGFFRVKGNLHQYPEQIHHPVRAGVILQAWPGVNQPEALIRFHQGADQPGLLLERWAVITGKAVEEVDGHKQDIFTLPAFGGEGKNARESEARDSEVRFMDGERELHENPGCSSCSTGRSCRDKTRAR